MKNALAIQYCSISRPGGEGGCGGRFFTLCGTTVAKVEARRTANVRLASAFHMGSEPRCPAAALLQSTTHSSAKARSAGQSDALAAS